MAKGALTLHGWIYEIESGQILAYDPQMSHFVPITSESVLPTLTSRPMATARLRSRRRTVTPATANEWGVFHYPFNFQSGGR